ncbi:hypothetical protein DFH11DRAFT_1570782 [Phellopilus nigrolimitatus]|nr:hypothetical protein DFH11DRAFT_1570782 [Phellopilus nigrolimitatus]
MVILVVPKSKDFPFDCDEPTILFSHIECGEEKKGICVLQSKKTAGTSTEPPQIWNMPATYRTFFLLLSCRCRYLDGLSKRYKTKDVLQELNYLGSLCRRFTIELADALLEAPNPRWRSEALHHCLHRIYYGARGHSAVSRKEFEKRYRSTSGDEPYQKDVFSLDWKRFVKQHRNAVKQKFSSNYLPKEVLDLLQAHKPVYENLIIIGEWPEDAFIKNAHGSQVSTVPSGHMTRSLSARIIGGHGSVHEEHHSISAKSDVRNNGRPKGVSSKRKTEEQSLQAGQGVLNDNIVIGLKKRKVKHATDK